jgi:hypothetical protein
MEAMGMLFEETPLPPEGVNAKKDAQAHAVTGKEIPPGSRRLGS